MKRRVLIIGSPLAGQNFLIGVEDDVQNFYRYVRSSIGGAYLDSEIKYLPNPSRHSVQKELNTSGSMELLTVYFSGHGGRSNNVDFAWLNEKEAFPITSFFTRAKRHIIITDACRTPIDTREYGDVISGVGFHFPTEYSDLARRLHFNYVNHMPAGGILIYATSENMPSIDSESGGVYTKSFMTALHNWYYTQREKVITAHQVFQRSCAITKKHEPLQIPKLHYYQTIDAINIPLGINPKAHLNMNRSASLTRVRTGI